MVADPVKVNPDSTFKKTGSGFSPSYCTFLWPIYQKFPIHERLTLTCKTREKSWYLNQMVIKKQLRTVGVITVFFLRQAIVQVEGSHKYDFCYQKKKPISFKRMQNVPGYRLISVPWEKQVKLFLKFYISYIKKDLFIK